METLTLWAKDMKPIGNETSRSSKVKGLYRPALSYLDFWFWVGRPRCKLGSEFGATRSPAPPRPRLSPRRGQSQFALHFHFLSDLGRCRSVQLGGPGVYPGTVPGLALELNRGYWLGTLRMGRYQLQPGTDTEGTRPGRWEAVAKQHCSCPRPPVGCAGRRGGARV